MGTFPGDITVRQKLSGLLIVILHRSFFNELSILIQLRAKGEEVIFIGGSDEHGVPITIKAQKEGVTPQDIVDRYHSLIKKSFEEFGISFDIYSRTSSETHHKLSSAFFKKLYEDGKFIEKTSMQYYDEKVSLGS